MKLVPPPSSAGFEAQLKFWGPIDRLALSVASYETMHGFDPTARVYRHIGDALRSGVALRAFTTEELRVGLFMSQRARRFVGEFPDPRDESAVVACAVLAELQVRMSSRWLAGRLQAHDREES